MKSLILGTDWWTDCDDGVALRLLTNAHKAGHIRLLGIVINACMEDSVRSMDAFLAKDGVTDVPIALDPDATDFGGRLTYQFRLAPHAVRYRSNADAENGVTLYRRLLAAADSPVEILEIGFLQVFSALLESRGDEISPKTGRELVAQKVSHCWVMAGKWDADGEKEHNFARNPRARIAAEQFCRSCPVPVTFLGWEAGVGILSGGELSHNDHLWQMLSDHGSAQGRHSWDPLLVRLALIGDAEKAGYSLVRGTARVDAETGENFFTPSIEGSHAYVIKEKEDSYYEHALNRAIIPGERSLIS